MPRRDPAGPYDLARLRALPAPRQFEADPAVLRGTLIAWFEGDTGRTLYPAQVETLLIDMLAYLWSLLGTEFEVAHQQRYAALADEAWLEQLGAGVGTPRLDPSRAVTTLRFTLAAPAAAPLLVPAGTRVSAGAPSSVFLTQGDLLVPVAATSADVAARADVAGVAASGLAAGAVATLMDPVAGVASAANVVATEGGADREDLELYRLRVANALERVSGAGPRSGYVEDVMAVSPAIIDVAVIRPAPCYIDVYALTKDGPAGPALNAAIAAALDPETERPMGDLVTPKACVAVTFALVIELRATRDLAGLKLEAERQAAAIVLAWRRSLGRSVNGGLSASEIVDQLKAIVGVVHVAVGGLSYLALAEQEFGVCTGVVVTVLPAGYGP